MPIVQRAAPSAERPASGSLARDTLVVAVATLAGFVVSVLSRPLLARLLGPSEYGVFALILAAGAVIPAFTLLALNLAVTFYAARGDKRQAREYVASALAFTTLSTLVLAVPLRVIVQLLFPALGLDEFASALVLSYGLSVFYVVQAGQQGVQDYSGFGRSSASSALLAALLSVGAAALWPSGSWSGIARGAGLLLVSFAVIQSLGGLTWPRGGLKGVLARLRQLVSYAWPLAVSGFLSSFIIIIDRYFLAATHANADVAFFDLAYSTGTVVLPLTVSLLIALAPKVMREPKAAPAYYKPVAKGNVFVIALYGFTLFAFAEPLVRLGLGDAYAPVALPLRLVGAALPLMALYQLNSSFLASVDRTRAYGLLSAALVVVSLAFNAWLVPPFGAPGAAVANWLSYVVIAALGSWWLRRTVGVSLRAMVPTLGAFYAFMALDTFWLHATGLTRVALWVGFGLVSLALNLDTAIRLYAETRAFLSSKLHATLRLKPDAGE